MKCPNCGTENRSGARFCQQCAKPLPAEAAEAAQVCPSCGARIRSGSLFCKQCGASLAQAGPGPTPVVKPEPPPPSWQPTPPPAWSAPPPAPPSPEKPRRGIAGCAWALIAAGVVGGLILVLIAVVAVLWVTTGGIPVLLPSPTPTATATPTPTDTPTPTPTNTPTPTPTALPTATFTPTPLPIPQECGMSAATADYGPIKVGTVVILGRHRPVNGDDNWAVDMGEYVGEEATVTRLSGVDLQGCPGVRVDIDDGRWFWRIRDLSLP
jgi:hypothetical protein